MVLTPCPCAPCALGPFAVAKVLALPATDATGRPALLATGWDASGHLAACLVVDSPIARAAAVDAFFHVVSSASGVVESRQITSGAVGDANGCFSGGGATAVVGRSTLLESAEDRVVGLAYPATADMTNAPAQILGDDSLLIKVPLSKR